MIDSHTHLFDVKFSNDLPATIARAAAVGVDRFILPATLPDEHNLLFDTVKQHPDIFFATIGLHPLGMNNNNHWRDDLNQIEAFLKHPPVKFYAIGETGLDMYWESGFLAEQTDAFVAQIELAIKYDLPLVLHMRDAWDYVFKIMEPYRGKVRGVFHSFNGTSQHVEQIERIGNFIYGINGTVTYKKSAVAEALPAIDINKIMLETDAPYLPPEGHRGKRNEPAFLEIISGKVAAIKGVSVDQLDPITTATTSSFFELPK